MSTRITVTSGSDALLASAKQVQDANRAAQLQRERDARTTATATAEVQATTLQPPVGGNPDTSIKRRPAAQRDTATLIPFALSWRGDLTERPATELEILLSENDGTPAVRPSRFTYTGGDYLIPNPFEIASSASKVQVAQPERYSEWKTVGQISLNNLTVANWTLEGFWAEELINPVYTDWPSSTPLTTSPGNFSPVGLLSHSATPTYLSVGTDGTMFVVVKLPAETVTASSAQLPDSSFDFPPSSFRSDVRPIWWGDPSSTSPSFLEGLQQYVQVGTSKAYSNYSLSPISSAGRSQPMHTFAYKEPYAFLRVKNGKIESKTAYYNSNVFYNPYNLETNFNAFIANNSYADDPGKNLRATYSGEVRIRGNKAHILRMRYEEVFEGETYTWYENFPFPSLTGFITGTGAQAKLQPGVTFEDHIYTLSSYSSDGELAAQLAAITTPVGTPTNPPYAAKPVSVSSSFVAAAAERISTTGTNALTPLKFFAAMP